MFRRMILIPFLHAMLLLSICVVVIGLTGCEKKYSSSSCDAWPDCTGSCTLKKGGSGGGSSCAPNTYLENCFCPSSS